ncbi:polymorphic toxin-type HINT domain-containing protein [Streptomyces goshikiensis]|uniref:polymorphic toxin-type HINT domain-containing protein n=1 Tax=Streptomyces goshikiensis TaxID=1942 RepID=UPI003663333E
MSLRGRLLNRRLSRRTLGSIAIGLSLTLSASTVQALAATNDGRTRAPGVQGFGDPVKGTKAKAKGRPADAARKAAVTKLDKPVWPVGGSAVAAVPAAGAKAAATQVKPGGLPVTVTPAQAPAQALAHAKGAHLAPLRDEAVEPGSVKVSVLDPKRAGTLGGAGTLMSVQRSDAGPQTATVRLNVDYSAFADGFGGSYGSRLQLVQLPACAAVATPGSAACPELPKPLKTVNSAKDRKVSADVIAAPAASPWARSADSGAALVALTAGASSSQGDYSATPMGPSAKWAVATQSGGFSWTYPLRTPQAPGGLVPNVDLGYSSQSADGRTADTNNQGSWLGEGFSYEPGYIERRYKDCADDGHEDSAEQCWAFENATVLLNGMSSELVKDDTTGTWHLSADNGSKVEKSTGAANGDNDGEYWKITTTDGTEYFFGKNRMTGWAAGNEETQSVWTLPVFGDDAGEPCHNATFANASCQQAWRWGLDHVKDPQGNVMTYFYGRETNYYALNGKTDVNGTAYHSGGYLKRIDYGQRDGQVYAAKAPARMVFDTAERCLPTDTFACADADFKKENAAQWPDVPMDRYCAAGTKCAANQVAPSFWTRKRLAGVTTQIRKDATQYQDVDAWTFTHLFTDNGDQSKTLWLSRIDHEGRVGTTAKMPAVELFGTQLANRVDALGDNIAPFHRFRLATVLSESGGQLDVNYAPADCAKPDLPKPGESTKRCYPVVWSPPGYLDPITDWFHKYVVAEVIETDRTGGAEPQITRYDYQGPAAWRKAEPDGITDEKYLTWGGWQGYGRVKVTSGTHDKQTARIEYTYLRGMDGDKDAAGGTRAVQVKDSEGGTYTDSKEFSGHELEAATYDGDALVSKVIKTPSVHHTATQTNSWGTSHASIASTPKTRGFKVVEGGDGRRETESNAKFDLANGTGRVTESEDLGDLSTSSDDQCTRTSYADNTATNILGLVSRSETVAVACSATPDRKTQVISDERTSYDGGAFGAAPTRGEITRKERLASHDGTKATYQTVQTTSYDAVGRPLSQVDALGAETKFAYTDVNGLVSQMKATNALDHVITTDFAPAWGQSYRQTDPNGKRTELTHDGLGRVVAVRLADRASNQSPSIKYTYTMRTDKPVSLKTEKLEADGVSYGLEYELFDSMLRPRQKQTEGPGGTRMVADLFYGGTGKVTKSYATYNAAGAPSDDLLIVRNGDVGAQNLYEYDGIGRTTAEIFAVSGAEQWRTTYSHKGDRTHVDPPVGGTPRTVITDARDRTTEVRQYKGSAPVPGGPASGYDKSVYAYAPDGALKKLTDAAGNVWSYKYDQRGRLTEAGDPDSGTRKLTYDDADHPLSVTDARGKTVSTVYDKLERIVSTWEGAPNTGTKLSELRYDKAGWLGEQWASLRYTSPTEYFATVTQAMDSFYRPIKTAYGVPASQGALAGTYVYTSTYNTDGSKQTDGVPAMGGLDAEALAYTYDDLQRPKTMTGATSYVTNTVWSNRSMLQQLELSNGGKKVWQTFGYETGTDRMTRSAVDVYGSTTGPAKESAYSYDQSGNVLSIADTAGSGTPDLQCFAYDYHARMTEAWTPAATKAAAALAGTTGTQVPVSGKSPAACGATPGSSALGGPAAYWKSYGFDSVGNRLSETVHDAGLNATKDVKRTFTYNPGTHQVSKVLEKTPTGDRQYTYGYDVAGNTNKRTIGGNTQTLDYDATGKVVKNSTPDDVTTPGKNEASDTTYVYGLDGTRLQRKDPSGTTVYLPGAELRLDAGSSTAKATRYYGYAGQTIAIRTPDKKLSFLASDHHGTGEMAIDAATGAITQRRMDPYGNSRGSLSGGSWPGEKGFVGGTIDDATGLTTVGAREYDSFLGKFISPDPVADTNDTQQLNAYAYAHNRPVTNSDPTGLYDPDVRQACREGWVNVRCGNAPASTPPPATTPEEEELEEAEEELDFIVQDAKEAVGKLIAIAKQELGVDAALDCFSSGDLGSCGETALTVLSSFAGGVAGKLIMKYGLRWKKAAELVKKVWGLVDDLIGYAKKWWEQNKAVKKAKDKLKKLDACHSFLPGTAVVLADGTQKNIEDVQPGDEVVTTDPSTGETVTRTVVGTIVTEDDKEFVDLTISQGAGEASLVATVTHPFWVENEQKFIEAGDLKPGMLLRTPQGDSVPVEALRFFDKRQRTHDLTIADIHAFYVVAGNTPLLVHNCKLELGALDDWLQDQVQSVVDQWDQNRTLPDGVKQGGVEGEAPGTYRGKNIPGGGDQKPLGYWTEMDVYPTPDDAKHRSGQHRLVIGRKGEVWYTPHYKPGSWIKLRGGCSCNGYGK